MTARRRARVVACAVGVALAIAGRGSASDEPPPLGGITTVLGRPTHDSMTINVRPEHPLDVFVEFGREGEALDHDTPIVAATAAHPAEVELRGLAQDARYRYRVRGRAQGNAGEFAAADLHAFQTQRLPGATFTFAVQGDSHPERERTMFSAALYTRTLDAVAGRAPDFYLTSGDDFSVDTLKTFNQASVEERYTLQLPFLSRVGASAPLFLVNGNHEQAARYLLDGTPDNVAVWAQNARNRFYPQPAPDGFYSGNEEAVPHVGLLRNYFAWEWGDALFVVIDPYWASPVPVDNALGVNGGKTPNLWDVTHGDAQYAWLRETLEQSTATWKFVFAHHVMGTGRGGIEVAGEYEWGGRDRNGSDGFEANRPGWPLPIHELLAANHVTIFFQGHDHLFAWQQLDGVAYVTLPSPADNTYTAWNASAYKSGDTHPGSGYVAVTVSPERVGLEYVRVFLPDDERAPDRVSGTVQFSTTIPRGR